MCPGFWFGAYGLRIQGAAFAARGMSRRGQFAVEQGVQQPTIVTRAVTYDRLLSSMQSVGYTILSMCMKMYIHMHMLYIYIYIHTYTYKSRDRHLPLGRVWAQRKTLKAQV